MNICIRCSSYKPKRAKHCIICQRCIKVYDHHCPWINNCIGSNNHLFFFMFLLVLFIFTCFKLSMTTIHLNQNTLIFQYDFQFLAYPKIEIFHFVINTLTMIITIILIIPLLMLLQIQLISIISNRTQYERYGH